MISGRSVSNPDTLIARLEEDIICSFNDRRFVNTHLARWLFSNCEVPHAPSSIELLKMAKSIVFAFPSTAYNADGDRPWVRI